MGTESCIENGIHSLYMKNFFLSSFCFFLYEELNELENLDNALEKFKTELIDTAFCLEIPLHYGISFKEIMSVAFNKAIINKCVDAIINKTAQDFINYLSDDHLKQISATARIELLSKNQETYTDVTITGVSIYVEDPQLTEGYVNVYKAIKKTINGEMFHNDGSHTTFS